MTRLSKRGGVIDGIRPLLPLCCADPVSAQVRIISCPLILISKSMAAVDIAVSNMLQDRANVNSPPCQNLDWLQLVRGYWQRLGSALADLKSPWAEDVHKDDTAAESRHRQGRSLKDRRRSLNVVIFKKTGHVSSVGNGQNHCHKCCFSPCNP